MRLDEQLLEALEREPGGDEELLVKLLRLEHGKYPGREVHGTLPLVVIGHQALSKPEWRRWVKENAVGAYGAAHAKKMAQSGVDIKEMLPSAPFGRALKLSEQRRRMAAAKSDDPEARMPQYEHLRQAQSLLVLVEKWPSLYNEIVNALSEQVMTLREFMLAVESLPSPVEARGRHDVTLGDLMGRLVFSQMRV